MIYNFNSNLWWASSGIEYAQLYRAKIFRKLGYDAKYIFTEMFRNDNIEYMAANVGYLDSEIIWLYTYFTDTKISPTTFTLKDLEDTIKYRKFNFTRTGKTCKYLFPDNGDYFLVHMVNDTEDLVWSVDIVSKNYLIRKDYYTYCKIFSEYFAPVDNKAHPFNRRFFNEDGSIAYEEINDDGTVMYRFPDRVICSKDELIGYMVQLMNITKDDVVILDRSYDNGQPILENIDKDVYVLNVIHAEHFSEGDCTNDTNILWNNFYEYGFSQYKNTDYFICATPAQTELFSTQFNKYIGDRVKAYTIPVGSVDKLIYPIEPRKKHSLITASRLAEEKNVKVLVDAVIKAKEKVPDITFDIYGSGTEEDDIKNHIKETNSGDYIRMMGQQKLDDVYIKYDAYISASRSEGFGLSLLEAIASGLPIIGFDVRYGNQTFIDDGENGFKELWSKDYNEKVDKIADAIVTLFTECNIEEFQNHSYNKAKQYLTSEVESKWETMIKITKTAK